MERPAVHGLLMRWLAMCLILGSCHVIASDEREDNAFYNGVVAYRAFKFEEAARWFTEAAEGGDVEAQFLLGRMHYDGNSLSVDNVTAWMWFDIASENGLPVGARYRAGVGRRLSEEETALAKQRSDEWRAAHPSPPRE